ncbi:MAG: hypothetical protein FWC65_05205 [Treponema sp.]|nr:hypothetical protein [Treponema sp.]
MSFVKWPALVDGKLTFVKIQFPIIEKWDDCVGEYVFTADIGVLHDEIISLVISLYTYNILIDFWYNKTGELLDARVDHDAILNDIQNLLVLYQNKIN